MLKISAATLLQGLLLMTYQFWLSTTRILHMLQEKNAVFESLYCKKNYISSALQNDLY